MKIASIDLGSNSVILLVAEFSEDGKIRPLFEKCEITRIGENLSKTGRLSTEAMDRTMEQLRKYTALAHKHQVERILCIATEALRRAENSQEFVQRVQKNCGFKVEIISGLKEARLAYLSAYFDFKKKYSNLVVLDIGGGSTELIWKISSEKSNNRIRTLSMKLGSVRLTEEIVKQDPISKEEFLLLKANIKQKLDSDLENIELPQAPFELIGLAGTLTTLSQIDQKLLQFDSQKIQGVVLSLNSLENIIEELKNKTIAERCQIIGMESKRADVILAGACILEGVLKRLKIDRVVVSDRGIRYGILYDRFMTKKGE
ncbi:MAG: Ppx/GppA family phosphatase [Deltaproteobacteria bacterium]|nr:Ppx/GppA family phosphatase [Deltaproteobacteria bacterium]